jgi:ceramide glucosyltransferase
LRPEAEFPGAFSSPRFEIDLVALNEDSLINELRTGLQSAQLWPGVPHVSAFETWVPRSPLHWSEMLATAVSLLTTILTLAGLAFCCVALWAARAFVRDARSPSPCAPPVSILKPLKGLDPGIYEALASHCRQLYDAPFEMLFGLSDLADPASAVIGQLRADFPSCDLRAIHCPNSLGANGKVSNLAQMLPHARYDHILISDGDITVAPGYLTRILSSFAGPHQKPVGLVTAPYRGLAHGPAGGQPTLGSRLEALAIATDFFPGVLTARLLEHGIHFGLGSTLATTREALAAIGGLEPLVNHLADDYELGARISRAGYRIILAPEVVATSIPAYTLSGFWSHQLRWARAVRDSRRAGYLGLALTYALPWALLNLAASGLSLASLALLSLVLAARVAAALSIGVGILEDRQVLRDLWLLPLRDCLGLALWAWSYAEDSVLWRGERLHLRRGLLTRQR